MGVPVSLRQLLIVAFAAAVLALVAIVFVDRPAARALQHSAPQSRAVAGPVMNGIELAFGFPLSKFLTGAVILIVAGALFPFARHRSTAWLLTLLGAAQLTTRLVAGMVKNVFLRPRPFEMLAGTAPDFFTAGSSFPSGHAAHFWPLFFVAAVAFPRWRVPALLLALFVSISRVLVNDHYIGDVTASASLAAMITYGFARLCLPRAARAAMQKESV